MEMGAKDLWSV